MVSENGQAVRRTSIVQFMRFFPCSVLPRFEMSGGKQRGCFNVRPVWTLPVSRIRDIREVSLVTMESCAPASSEKNKRNKRYGERRPRVSAWLEWSR